MRSVYLLPIAGSPLVDTLLSVMNRSCLAAGCAGEADRSCDLQPLTLKVRSVLVLLGKYMYIQAPVLAISGED